MNTASSKKPGLHPHSRIVEICAAEKIALFKGQAAEIYAKTKSVDKNAILQCARELTATPSPRALARQRKNAATAARRASEIAAAEIRHAATLRLEAALPPIVAGFPFHDPDAVAKTLHADLLNDVIKAGDASIDHLLQRAAAKAFAQQRARDLIAPARKRAKSAGIICVDGEPAEASLIAADLDIERWLSKLAEDENKIFRSFLVAQPSLCAETSPLFHPIASESDAETFDKFNSDLLKLRKKTPTRLSEADILERAVVIAGATPPGLEAISGALKARRDEIQDRKNRHKQWENSLLNAPSTREALGATPSEFSRWIAERKIPVAKVTPFHKWGRNLEATYHDPALFPAIKDAMPQWREDHAENLKIKRKKTALVTAGHASNTDATSLAQTRRLKALTKSSSIEGAAIVASQSGPKLIHPCSIGVNLTLSDAAPISIQAISVLLTTPLNADTTAPVAEKAPRGKARTAAVALIEAAAAQARATLTTTLANEIAAWRTRAIETSSGYPVEAVPAISAAITEQLLHFYAKGPVIQIRDEFRQALRNSIDDGMKIFLRRERVALIRARTGLADYPALFPAARAKQRRLVLNVGPTNSGKTHAALDQLAKAPSGIYAAPLRLMALEAHERLNNEHGTPCTMITGEEIITVENARHIACTIETADFEQQIDLAVIDEIQMLADAERGWAWTAALVGLAANTIIMTGSADAIPRVQAIAAMTGEDVEIKTFERLTPLTVEPTPSTLHDVRPGDAVIAFSRNEIMRLREALADIGKSVCVVYGALGPEVRRAEATRFRSGAADILVASDAVGMGLNLPCKRILFTALEKYDGFETRPLHDAEIRQIAGRAGRYGHHENGSVGVIGNNGLPHIRQALAAPPLFPRDLRPYVMPPLRAILEISDQIKTASLRAILLHFTNTVLDCDPCLRPADMEPSLVIASRIDRSGLDLKTKYAYLGTPLDSHSDHDQNLITEWSKKHAEQKTICLGSAKTRNVPATHHELQSLEKRVKTLSMYLWLALKWPGIYKSEQIAREERVACNGLIEQALRKSFLHRTCRECGSKLPKHHKFAICDSCHEDPYGYD